MFYKKEDNTIKEKYYSVEEIGKELNVSNTTIYKKARKLNINTKTITEEQKKEIIDSCKNYIDIRNSNEEIINYVNEKMKTIPNIELSSSDDKDSLNKMYELLIDSYNSNRKMIDECKLFIEYMGVMFKDYNGNFIANPILKTYLSLIKSSSILTKDIILLKDKVKESIYDFDDPFV